MLLARTLVAVGRIDEGFARNRSFVGGLGDIGMARDARYYWGDQLVAHGRLEEAIEVWRAAWPEHRSEPIVQRIGLRMAAALAETGGGDEADEILAWIGRRGDSSVVRAEAASDRRVLPLVGAAAPGLEAVSTEGAAFATLVAGATILFWDPAAPESIDGPFGLDRLAEAAAVHGQKVIAVALTKDEAAAKERAADLGPSVVLVVAEPALARGWELDRVPRTFRTDDGGRVVSYAITPARLVAGR
jgi:hypothetical protein